VQQQRDTAIEQVLRHMPPTRKPKQREEAMRKMKRIK
jgi:hypothetical protein